MPLDTAKLARSGNKTLGRAVTVYGAAGPVAITAEFRERYERVRVGVMADIAKPTLFPTAADWRRAEAVNGDQVAIDDCLYTIVDAQPHDHGLVEVTLRKYAE